MAGKRKAYTPFSTSSEAGITAAPVEGFIEVTQDVRPTLSTGFVDRKGEWQGHTTSDTEFSFYGKDEEVANGAAVTTPVDTGSLSMVGYNDIQLAIRVTNGGNYAIEAIMSSSGLEPYYNLKPVDAAADLRVATLPGTSSNTSFEKALSDSSEALTADVWNILGVLGRLKDQARLGFKITNNSGDITTIETMFLRLI